MQCPGCTQQLGEDGGCVACGGVWLSHEKLREHVADVETSGGTFSKRRCPVCHEPMQLPFVFNVPVDHCLEHGWWFDAAELYEVVKRSSDDAWRLYGAGGSPSSEAAHQARRWNPVGGLIEVFRAWRGSRQKP